MSSTTVQIPGAEAWAAEGAGDRAAVGIAVVHGFTGNPNSTRPLGERLHDEGYTVEVPRLPGHGTTVGDMRRTRYRDWRAHVEHVVDDLAARVEEIVLVGLSLGGTLCLDVTSQRPEGIAGVVAINSQVLQPDQFLARLAPILQYIAPVVPRDLAGLPSDDIARPDADERAYAKVPAKAAQSLIRELPRIRAQLRDLDRDVLVAYSPQDHSVRPQNSMALLELLGDRAEALVLERSYHVATLDWDADLLAERVLSFVERVTR